MKQDAVNQIERFQARGNLAPVNAGGTTALVFENRGSRGAAARLDDSKAAVDGSV